MRQELYFAIAEAKPTADNPERLECAGAFVNCFVHASGERAAEQSVKALLHSEGWEFVRMEELHTANRAQFAEDAEMLECCQEAEKYGSSAVFYIWENEDDGIGEEQQDAEK